MFMQVPVSKGPRVKESIMPGVNTLLIDGSFKELAEELAQYLDDRQEKTGQSTVQSTILPLLEQGRLDDALIKLVDGSAVLNTAPEKEFVAAYNLLVHLIKQARKELRNKCLQKVCRNLANPIVSSPTHGPGLALTVLTTIFNILHYDDETRYNVLQGILSVIRKTGSASFESLKLQLIHLDSWFEVWETDDEDQRRLLLAISSVAEEFEEYSDSYFYLIRALRTFDAEEADTEEARTLSIKALKSALSRPSKFDFQDVTALDSVQSLRKTDALLFELLELFTSQGLEEFTEFKDEHGAWLSQQNLDIEILDRKIRLLTLASIASQAQTRSLPYDHIARHLQIPVDEVEMWVIDVIRAGVVEGKLSQLNQTFLIHRSTHRVFGEKQWSEVQGRLDTWRTSLENVLSVVRQERDKVNREKEREMKEIENRIPATAPSRRANKEIDVGGGLG